MASSERSLAPGRAPALALALRVLPEPIRAVPAAAGDFTWTAAFSVLLLETGGVSGWVYAVQAVLLEAPDPRRMPTDRQVSLVAVDLGSHQRRNRLPARGRLAVPVTVHYTLPGGLREAVVDVAGIVVGDDGYYHHANRRCRIR